MCQALKDTQHKPVEVSSDPFDPRHHSAPCTWSELSHLSRMGRHGRVRTSAPDVRHSGADEGEVQERSAGCRPAWFPVFEHSGPTAGRVIPGESGPVAAQDPGRPHLTVSSQDSTLVEETGVLGGGQGQSVILGFSQQRFWLQYKCQPPPITCTHYPDALFLRFHLLDLFR